jgi:hypothetical protein
MSLPALWSSTAAPGHIWKELAWKRSGSPWVLGSSVSGMSGARR